MTVETTATTMKVIASTQLKVCLDGTVPDELVLQVISGVLITTAFRRLGSVMALWTVWMARMKTNASLITVENLICFCAKMDSVSQKTLNVMGKTTARMVQMKKTALREFLPYQEFKQAGREEFPG